VAVGTTSAVCVCAAPAVAATIVSIDTGAGAESVVAGNGKAGNSHASRINNAAKKGSNFFTAELSMFNNQLFYWTEN
jgi:hypothetical protein